MIERSQIDGGLNRTRAEKLRQLADIETRLAATKPAIGAATREQLLRKRAEIKKEIDHGSNDEEAVQGRQEGLLMNTAAAAPPASEAEARATDVELAAAVRSAHEALRCMALEQIEIIRSQIRRYELTVKAATDAGLDVKDNQSKRFCGDSGLAGTLHHLLRPFDQDPDAPLPDTSTLVIQRIIIRDF